VQTSPPSIRNSSSHTSLQAPQTGASKNLTLKQLKELLEEIYLSKQKFDQK